jgi:hypothetical protein
LTPTNSGRNQAGELSEDESLVTRAREEEASAGGRGRGPGTGKRRGREPRTRRRPGDLVQAIRPNPPVSAGKNATEATARARGAISGQAGTDSR